MPIPYVAASDLPKVIDPDDTVRLIREYMIQAEQLSRYYGYLAHRLRRLSEILGFAVVGFSIAGLFTVLSPLPRWVPLLLFISTVIAGIIKAVGRYEIKAVFSGNLYRQLQQFSINWSDLYADVGRGRRNDEELHETRRSLCRRQQTALLFFPVELPLSNRLMLRCRREAEQHWFMRQDSSLESMTEADQ